MPSSALFLRQLSAKETSWKSTSNRWSGKNNNSNNSFGDCGESNPKNHHHHHHQMEGFNMYGNEVRKRVMVVVDDTSHSKHAMMWALTHLVNKVDLFTLLHILPPHSSSSSSTYLVNHLASLCKNCKPEVINFFPCRS